MANVKMYSLCSKTLSSELQLHYGLRSNVVWAHMYPHTHTLHSGGHWRASFHPCKHTGLLQCIKSQSWRKQERKGFRSKIASGFICNILLYFAKFGYIWQYFAIFGYIFLYFAIFCYTLLYFGILGYTLPYLAILGYHLLYFDC